MKKNISRALIFTTILFIIIASLSISFERSFKYEEGIKAVSINSLDYLAIGDSESYSTISPMQIYHETGIKGYNLGEARQKLQDTYFNLKSTLKFQHPKVVLFETNAIFREFSTTESSYGKFNAFIKKCFPIYDIHTFWKQLLSSNKVSSGDSFSKNPLITNNSVLKGFRYNTKINPYTKGNYVKISEQLAVIKSTQVEYLNKIINLCKENKIELVFFSAPSPKNWTYDQHNTILNIAKKNNYAYLDFNTNNYVNIDWNKDTYDKGDHLNYFGATKISSFIADYLKNNTCLKDSISKDYLWDKAYITYHKMISNTAPQVIK